MLMLYSLSLILPALILSSAYTTTSPSTMGLPYSKQINAAFDQVTPLVAAGFEVLQTTKNISILLAAIQVLTVIFLGLIIAEMFALLVTMNPALENERDMLITPAVKWVAQVCIGALDYSKAMAAFFWIVVVGGCIGGVAGLIYTSRDPTLRVQDDLDGEQLVDTNSVKEDDA